MFLEVRSDADEHSRSGGMETYMTEPETCGRGLAERSALPANLGALSAAMADTLETHQRTLDLTDHNARAEHEAYEAVASALRTAAAQLQSTADRMAGYRELPLARHDERATNSFEVRDAFEKFIEREHDLSALLNIWVQQDRALLEGEPAGADSPAVVIASLSVEDIGLTRVPTAQTGMLIRKPVGEVFEAIVNPEITTQFWFTKASGPLEAGKRVRWDWEMYGVSVDVFAKAVEPNARIVIEWPGYSGPTTVEWRFAPRNGATFVSVSESGFTGSGDQLVKYLADSTQGFSLMLAGLKAFLEHGVRLNLTADRYPEGIEEQAERIRTKG
jgi:uncharacterized protein YndB with AHSA1/START domain